MKNVRAAFTGTMAMLLMTAWARGTAGTGADATGFGRCARCDEHCGQRQGKRHSLAQDGYRKDRRRATKLYLQASKLFENQQYDAAMRDYKEAAELDPGNPNYAAATEIARRPFRSRSLSRQRPKRGYVGTRPPNRLLWRKRRNSIRATSRSLNIWTRWRRTPRASA